MSEPTFGAAALSEAAPRPARSGGAPMAGLVGRIRSFARDARGGTAIEYAMIGGLIFAVVAGTIRIYGSKVDGVYGRIGSAMAQIN